MNSLASFTDDDGWSWTAAPAISDDHGKLFCNVVAYDGEFAVSYLYAHDDMKSRRNVIYEFDGWFADLYISPDGRKYVAGNAGRLHVQIDGEWSVSQCPVTHMLTSICLGSGAVLVTSKNGIFRFEDDRWSHVYDTDGNYLNRIICLPDGRKYAVGCSGQLIQFNGRNWSAIELDTNIDINSVAVSPAGTIYACGDVGTLIVGENQNWNIIEIGDVDFVDIAVFDNQIYLAGGVDGLFLLEDGQSIVNNYEILASRLRSSEKYLCASGGIEVHRFDKISWEKIRY